MERNLAIARVTPASFASFRDMYEYIYVNFQPALRYTGGAKHDAAQATHISETPQFLSSSLPVVLASERVKDQI